MSGINLLLDSSSLSSDPADFYVTYPDGIDLQNKKWELSLINCNVWYSWFNIASYYGNNTLGIFVSNEWKWIHIEDGIYDIEQLNELIKQQLIDWNLDPELVALKPNYSTLKLIIKLQGVKVDLTKGSLHELLGFDKKIIEQSEQGNRTLDITRGVDTILIHCHIIESSYINGMSSDILYSFMPNSAPGSLIQISPNNPIYLPIQPLDKIAYIRMRLTDQRNRPVNLNGENIVYHLHLRPIK
jgi:hypothetical protein